MLGEKETLNKELKTIAAEVSEVKSSWMADRALIQTLQMQLGARHVMFVAVHCCCLLVLLLGFALALPWHTRCSSTFVVQSPAFRFVFLRLTFRRVVVCSGAQQQQYAGAQHETTSMAVQVRTKTSVHNQWCTTRCVCDDQMRLLLLEQMENEWLTGLTSMAVQHALEAQQAANYVATLEQHNAQQQQVRYRRSLFYCPARRLSFGAKLSSGFKPLVDALVS